MAGPGRGVAISGGVRGAPVSAETSRATPSTDSASARFGVRSNTKTRSPRTSCSGVPGGREVSRTRIPSCSVERPSSASEHTIPPETTPRMRDFFSLRGVPVRGSVSIAPSEANAMS